MMKDTTQAMATFIDEISTLPTEEQYQKQLKADRKATRIEKKAARKQAEAASVRRAPGKQFHVETLEDLARSGLDESDAVRMRIKDLTPERAGEKYNKNDNRAGYELVYHDFAGKPIGYERIRYTYFREKTDARYKQRIGTGIALFIPRRPDIWKAMLADLTAPVCITEGEKKGEFATKAGIPTVAIAGVDSFASSKRDIIILPQIAQIAAGGRPIPIVYDSDVITKDEVRVARKKLAIQVYLAGGVPQFIDLPPGETGEKVGLDDYLLKHSVKDFNALPRTEVPAALMIAWLRNRKKSEKLGYDSARVVGRIVTEAMARAGRFLKTDTTPQERIYCDTQSRRLYQLDDKDDEDLHALIQFRFGVNGADLEWKQVHERVRNECTLYGGIVKVHKFAFYDAKNLTSYVAKSEGEIFQITLKGRSVVPNGFNDVFIRANGLTDVTLAKTATRAAFKRISGLANIKLDEAMSATSAQLLWECWQLAVFFPQEMATRPLVLFTGQPGSGKTSAARATGRSLMGPNFGVVDIDKNKLDGFDSAVVANHFCVFDNVDGQVPGIENKVATLCTGGMLSRRKYFKTMQEIKYPADAFAVVTAFNPLSFTRSDIVDRQLILTCEANPKGFKLESVLNRETDENRPAWWLFVLDSIPKIIAGLAKADSQQHETLRLADFARFVRVAGTVLEYTAAQIREAIAQMQTARAEFVAGMSSIPGALQTLVERRVDALSLEVKLHGSKNAAVKKLIAEYDRPLEAGELLSELQSEVDGIQFKSARSFGINLKSELSAINRRVTLIAEFDLHSKKNRYSLSPIVGWLKAVEASKVRLSLIQGGLK